MYVRYEDIPASSVKVLRSLSKQLPFIKAESHRRRMGANTYNALSIYDYTRWYHWNATQRKQYKALLNPRAVEKSVVGWYLRIPAGEGFLDTQTAWVGVRMTGTVVAVALGDNQTIEIGDESVTLDRGQCIGFSLREIHEIKPSPQGQLWACLMMMAAPDEIVE